MILLASTSDKIQVQTSSTADIDVHASYVDLSGSTITPSRDNTQITSIATTDVVAPPGASTQRTVKSLFIRNKHATTANNVTVIHTDGTTAVELIKVTLNAGYTLRYDEGNGFEILDAFGRTLLNNSDNGSNAAVNALNLVVLNTDVINNNATANTIADVTGLSFSVTAGEKYWFRATVQYTSAATGTGSRWAMNGPTGAWRYKSEYSLTTTTLTTVLVIDAQSRAIIKEISVANDTNAARTVDYFFHDVSATTNFKFYHTQVPANSHDNAVHNALVLEEGDSLLFQADTVNAISGQISYALLNRSQENG